MAKIKPIVRAWQSSAKAAPKVAPKAAPKPAAKPAVKPKAAPKAKTPAKARKAPAKAAKGAGWDESKHPRVPAGSGDPSGEFAPKSGARPMGITQDEKRATAAAKRLFGRHHTGKSGIHSAQPQPGYHGNPYPAGSEQAKAWTDRRRGGPRNQAPTQKKLLSPQEWHRLKGMGRPPRKRKSKG